MYHNLLNCLFEDCNRNKKIILTKLQTVHKTNDIFHNWDWTQITWSTSYLLNITFMEWNLNSSKMIQTK